MSSAASAGLRAFGLDRGLPFPLADVEQADVRPARRLQPRRDDAAGGAPPRRAARARRAVIVVDPRRTPTADRADASSSRCPAPTWRWRSASCTCWSRAASRRGLRRHPHRRLRADVRESVAGWWPERVERVTGVPADEVRALADLLGGAPKVVVLTARGAEQHSTGSDTVLAWINLALALGHAGTPGAGYGCLTGQGNGQGGREHGQKADQLPGYRMIDDPAARAHVAGVWGVDPDVAARQGALGVRAARRARTAGRTRGAARLRLQHRRLGARRHPRHRARWSRSTCWSSPTWCSPRPRRSPTSCCRSPSGPRRPAP